MGRPTIPVPIIPANWNPDTAVIATANPSRKLGKAPVFDCGLQPEKKLYAAVLIGACRDLGIPVEGAKYCGKRLLFPRRLFNLAWNWLHDTSGTAEISFLRCCEVLDLDPDCLLVGIRLAIEKSGRQIGEIAVCAAPGPGPEVG